MIIQGIDEQRVVQFVMDRYRELKDNRKEKEEIWLDCVRAYLSEFDEIWDEESQQHRRSKRFVSLSFDAVESLNSQLLSALFVGDKWLHFDPGSPGLLPYDDTAAHQVKALLLQQTETINLPRQYSILLKQLQITGNCPYTVGWRKEYATDYPEYEKAMRAWQADYGRRWGEYQMAMQEWMVQAQAAASQNMPPPPRPVSQMPEPPAASRRVAYAGPTFEVGDIFNFVIDPFSPDMQNALRIKRSFVCRNSLMRLSEKNDWGYSTYDNVENVKEVDRRGAESDDYEESRYQAFGLSMPSADQVELHEAWGTMEIPGMEHGEKDAYVSYCATIANGDTLIRFEPTFLWSGDCPVQLATFRDIPGQVYGIGQIEMGLGLQDIVNVRANQLIDATAYAINPEHIAVDDGIIDLRQKSAPGGVRLAGDIGNFRVLEKNFSGIGLGISELESLKREYQTLTKTQSPMATSRKESATRSSLDAGAINTDVAKIANHLETTSLKKIIELFLQLNAQYKNKKEAVKFLQKGKVTFLEVSPESLRKQWVVKIKGSQHVIDKQERIQNIMMFMQLGLGNPVIAPAIKPLELSKQLAEELGLPTEIIFRTEEEAEQVLQEMLRYGFFGNGGQGGDWRPQETDSRAASNGAGYSGSGGTGEGRQAEAGLPAANEENSAGGGVEQQTIARR